MAIIGLQVEVPSVTVMASILPTVREVYKRDGQRQWGAGTGPMTLISLFEMKAWNEAPSATPPAMHLIEVELFVRW